MKQVLFMMTLGPQKSKAPQPQVAIFPHSCATCSSHSTCSGGRRNRVNSTTLGCVRSTNSCGLFAVRIDLHFFGIDITQIWPCYRLAKKKQVQTFRAMDIFDRKNLVARCTSSLKRKVVPWKPCGLQRLGRRSETSLTNTQKLQHQYDPTINPILVLYYKTM